MKRIFSAAAIHHAYAFILLLITEIIIGIYGLGVVRSHVGDILILPTLYCLIRIVTSALPRSLPLWLFGVGCLTEFLQLIKLSKLLGFAEGSLPAVLLGTNADWLDILCYGMGTALLYAAMYAISKYAAIPKKTRCVISILGTIAVTIGLAACWAQMAITYRFDFDPDWMLGKSLNTVQERYVRYDAQAGASKALESQGYVFIGQDAYFEDMINSTGNFYYLYYVKCNENNIITDVEVVDTGIGG